MSAKNTNKTKTKTSTVPKSAAKRGNPPATKKSNPKKSTVKKSNPKKSKPQKSTVKKSNPKKSAVKKVIVKKSAVKKTTVKKVIVKKSAKKSVVKKSNHVVNEPVTSWLSVFEARAHNLKGLNVSFPIGAFSVVTGVSGSGKSSLVHDVIWKSLAKILHRNTSEIPGKVKSITGIEHLNKVINVNQQPIGQTPNSNPATYTGVFDLIREFFAKLPDAKLRGYSARRFSFNVPGGRCEKCEGAGQLKIEMHFLPDVWITCDACNGKRYDRQTLDVKYRGYSIADILEMTCADALKLFSNVPRICKTLQLLCDVGLDYLSLGQSAPTLSGGESQRIKLTSELTRPDTGRTLYLLDEPTTGLHFDDMNKLLHVIHRLVDLGNTVIVIEHNLDIIKNADWIVDLGLEAGDNGGYLLFQGTPEELVESGVVSHTAVAIAPVLKSGLYQERVRFDAANLKELRDNDVSDSAVKSESNLPNEHEVPWERNGIKWHTRDRICRNGAPVKWDGKILLEIVSQIEASGQFTPTDWNKKSIVEIRADKKSLGWFMHATTSDEWILKVNFRTAGGTFKRESLITAMALKPFDAIDKMPKYDNLSRVMLRRQTIQWQEIEFLFVSYDDINNQQFRDFLNTAIRGFARFIKPATEKKSEKLMDWAVLGKKWHFTPEGLIGGGKLLWDLSLLTEIFSILYEVAPDMEVVWTHKFLVQFFGKIQRNKS
ncbi:MAG: ATP-binding cassette domain-containing protein, partial [Planctomycetaceae bacterium]|nr:ATP-binding cassette domain-containing protein [Planctomycetaceae bacterium]